jgi:hypothetical protein
MKATLVAIFVMLAPLQCGHAPADHPQFEDSPSEALWDLSERFHAAGDENGRHRTLQYLIERYPSSRYAERARVTLGEGEAHPAP